MRVVFLHVREPSGEDERPRDAAAARADVDEGAAREGRRGRVREAVRLKEHARERGRHLDGLARAEAHEAAPAVLAAHVGAVEEGCAGCSLR